MTVQVWKWPLAAQILLGLLLGAVAGMIANSLWHGAPGLSWTIKNIIQPVGSIFLRMIFMMVIPLIVSAIVIGITQMGDVRKLGRLGLRCLLITVALACTSVCIGLLLVNWIQPGKQIPEERRVALAEQYGAQASDKLAQARQAKPLAQTLVELIPNNPLAEATNAFAPNDAGGGILAVMVFSLFVGIAMALAEQERVRALADFFQGMFAVCMKVIGMAMRIAPIGVACLAFSVAASLGVEVVRTLGLYVGVVVGGLALHQFVVYPVTLVLFSRVSPFTFFREIREAMITAFSTASGNATLPISLKVAEQNLRLPPQIARFVLTVGSSANQNGTALYEGVTVLFLAQVFGVELTVMQQVLVALMCVLAGIGTAGVPGGSLPLVIGVLVSVGVPGESIALILGVDRFLDMCRTTLNVTGDLVCAVVVSGKPAKVNGNS
jgi:DAACS family dicarboxylate/amino acid:cation (Na+ or H+) symporter